MVHPKDTSPDHEAFSQIAKVLSDYSHSTLSGNNIPKYRVNTMTREVYPVEGGFEDYVYAASWENALNTEEQPIRHCTPQVYKKDFDQKDINGASLVFLVEMSDNKQPPHSEYGTDENLLASDNRFYGHISRNLRLNLMLLDYTSPYVLIEGEDMLVSFRGCYFMDRIDANFREIGGNWQKVQINNKECYGVSMKKYALSDILGSIGLPEEYELFLTFSSDSKWTEKTDNDLKVDPQLYLAKLKNPDYFVSNGDFYYKGRNINKSATIVKKKGTITLVDEEYSEMLENKLYLLDSKGEETVVKVNVEEQGRKTSEWKYSLEIELKEEIEASKGKITGFKPNYVFGTSEEIESSLSCLENNDILVCATEKMNLSKLKSLIGGLFRFRGSEFEAFLIGEKFGSDLNKNSVCLKKDKEGLVTTHFVEMTTNTEGKVIERENGSMTTLIEHKLNVTGTFYGKLNCFLVEERAFNKSYASLRRADSEIPIFFAGGILAGLLAILIVLICIRKKEVKEEPKTHKKSEYPTKNIHVKVDTDSNRSEEIN